VFDDGGGKHSGNGKPEKKWNAHGATGRIQAFETPENAWSFQLPPVRPFTTRSGWMTKFSSAT
jgi:hypothetical protein